MTQMTAQRITIFPLPGVILFPGLQLPLHMFEPRYKAMVSDAMARDRQIGMIQPREPEQEGQPPALFDMGCLGRIADVEALDDGRYNVLLDGIARFRLVRELDVTTPFRQVEGELIEEVEEALAAAERAALEQEAKRFANAQGYSVDWDSVARLDDVSMVNGVAQIAPFDSAAKQALLEAETLSQRTELLIQLMQFFGRRDRDEDSVTLQ
ncbi:LON peptidase substrate-binding domain-containing protein [Alterisphingorhabdus coralli]|uniref:LON peptidase substrate-binding domain-containing protein n=1 Tax=Alterisphingorhabdus coralli TaxID=3071408 RepID=A0AA97I0G4_9SPHN|nr:LON peptidase substrate-binding domain-containing protein [Parasphingorhabdus sp. SCSIO 66989]WOE75649.1 LON peptidase substrate-binding domain-containing protein [Parasphingorhabdus sp. SCSIO 66989]